MKWKWLKLQNAILCRKPVHKLIGHSNKWYGPPQIINTIVSMNWLIIWSNKIFFRLQVWQLINNFYIMCRSLATFCLEFGEKYYWFLWQPFGFTSIKKSWCLIFFGWPLIFYLYCLKSCTLIFMAQKPWWQHMILHL